MKYTELYRDIGSLIDLSSKIISTTQDAIYSINVEDTMEDRMSVREIEIRQRLASDIMSMVSKYMSTYIDE